MTRRIVSKILLGWAASLLIAAPALARDWPKTAGWDIVEGDDFCLMHMEYEGPGDSALAIALYNDGRIVISDVNYGWSAEKGQIYPEISFALNGESYTGTAVGIEILGKKGFAMKFGGEILADIAAAPAVRVYKGDTLIDRLSLDGSAAALAMTKRCLAAVRTSVAAAERERKRWSDLPSDPFAAEKGGSGTLVSGPRATPRGNKASWITSDDYPAAAVRAREQGTVAMAVGIDTAGRVTTCEVTSSTGSTVLDAASCSLVQRRGRYAPAADVNGKLIPSSDAIRFHWVLPD